MMFHPTSHSIFAASLLLIVVVTRLPTSYGTDNTTSSAGSSDEATYCSCQYNVPSEEEADCRSYGQLGDDVLIPWHRANQTCMDEYQIQASAIDLSTLMGICPYDNATDADIQLLLNEIRFSPSPATRAIQSYYSLFWQESNTTVGSYELVNVINDGRNNPDCTTSETLCYNTIREYFTINPMELGTACNELHKRNRFEMDLEQSIVRIRLCQEVAATTTSSSGTTPSDYCEPLVSQIVDIRDQNPSRACSAFALGPRTAVVNNNSPNCGSSNGGGIQQSGSTGSVVRHRQQLRGLIIVTIATVLFALS